jgi:hypothetical protein
LAVVTGDNAWASIVEFEAGEGKEFNLPARLDDAWDFAKRSREYLNAKEHDLDARYFAHASVSKKEPKGVSWKVSVSVKHHLNH